MNLFNFHLWFNTIVLAVSHSSQTFTPLQIHEDLSRVKRFDAEGALEYGIIDRIIRPSRIKKEGSTAHRRDMRNLGLG